MKHLTVWREAPALAMDVEVGDLLSLGDQGFSEFRTVQHRVSGDDGRIHIWFEGMSGFGCTYAPDDLLLVLTLKTSNGSE